MGRGRKKKTGNNELTPLETLFMKVMWKQGSVTAAEMEKALSNRRPLAYTTIHTVMSNMRKKGFIEPVPTIERAIRFSPSVSKEKVAGRSLKKILKDFFDGSPERLMAHVIKEEKMGVDELREIRTMLNRYEKKESVRS